MSVPFVLKFEALAARRGRRQVFRQVGGNVADGQALIVTGANGSGKSSLLRVIAGLLPFSSGSLTWNDMPLDPQDEAHHRRLNYLGHLDALKPELTVTEQINYWHAFDPSMNAPPGLLANLRLEALAARPTRYLSAGQKRRLALGRLLMKPASLWLLDEPATALDTSGQNWLADLIAMQRASGGAVMIATHQPLEIPHAARLDLDAPNPADITNAQVWA